MTNGETKNLSIPNEKNLWKKKILMDSFHLTNLEFVALLFGWMVIQNQM